MEDMWLRWIIFFKKLFQSSNVKVTTRNNCAGGQAPKFFSLCNELEGDEDIVILETVYKHPMWWETFARNILNPKNKIKIPFLILLYWSPKDHLENWGSHGDLSLVADNYDIPLLYLKESVRGDKSKCAINGIFADSVHPNEIGHLG